MGTSELKQDGWGKHRPGWLARLWIRLCRGLPKWPGFRRLGLWLRRPLKYRLKGPVDTELWGMRLRLYPEGNLSEQRWLYLPQFADAMEREELVRRISPGGVFLDVGANAGLYSFWVWSQKGDGVRIEAFEPDPEMCRRMAFQQEANGVKSMRVNALALSDREGRARLAIGGTNRGRNRLGEEEQEGVEVEMTTLAAWVEREQLTRVDAMKIDVEGHESTILGHFFEHAPRRVWPRVLVCETLGDRSVDDPLRALVEGVGYREAARGRMNTLYLLEGGEAV